MQAAEATSAQVLPRLRQLSDLRGVVERLDRERVIYTSEIDPLRVVEQTDEKRVGRAMVLDTQ